MIWGRTAERSRHTHTHTHTQEWGVIGGGAARYAQGAPGTGFGRSRRLEEEGFCPGGRWWHRWRSTASLSSLCEEEEEEKETGAGRDGQ